MLYLGIDIGTSAIKLCVVDASGQVQAMSDAPLTVSHPFQGASEQDVADWADALLSAAQDLDPDLRRGIGAIGLSGQMHGAVLLDAERRPLRPAILWNDGRAASECATMIAEQPGIGHLAGVPPMPGFTAPKLRWLETHEPQTHQRIAHVLLPKDYLGFLLHGALVTDTSDAAGTSWLDQGARAWSADLCRASATDQAWLPDVRAGNDIAGHLTPDAAQWLGLPPDIPVAVGAGDAAAGAVGIGAVEEGDGFISLGTSGQLFVTTQTYRPNPDAMIHAYAHTLPDRWFQMAAMLNGARPLAWLAALLDRPIKDLLAEAETAEPSVLFLPYLTGERTPHADTDIRAGFWGMAETTTQGAMMRAVVEGIAFSFADAMDAMRASGTAPDTLLAIGGGTQSAFLLQTISDVIGVPIGRSEEAHIGPALGAARLAQMAVGGGAAADIAPKPNVARWFEPDALRAAGMAPRLAGYRALYPAMVSVRHAMASATP